MNMNKLMRPESVVVIGASDKKGMVGGATQSSVKGVNKDHVYYLNPRREEVNHRPCYHTLSQLPEVPDCMLICTPASTVAGYLEEGGRMGIRAAVVLASGFSEERSEQARMLSEQVREICIKYDMALCGPNCIGIVNGIDRVCVTANNDETMIMLQDDQRRGAGVIAQSGYISSGFNNPDCDYLACVVSAGNSIICGLEDYMLYMAEEDRINCIAAYENCSLQTEAGSRAESRFIRERRICSGVSYRQPGRKPSCHPEHIKKVRGDPDRESSGAGINNKNVCRAGWAVS